MEFSANGVRIDDDHSLSALIAINDREKPATRGSILAALASKGIAPERISAIAPTRQFNQWIVVAGEQETFDLIMETGMTSVADKTAEVTTYSSRVLFGRFLYLPPQLGDEEPKDFLSRYGTVRKFWREVSQESTCTHLETGIRSFILVPHKDIDAKEIPQTACIGGTEVLVRIRGQQPRCYGCNLAGHLKRNCGQAVNPKGKKEKQKADSGPKAAPAPAPAPAPAAVPAPPPEVNPAPAPASASVRITKVPLAPEDAAPKKLRMARPPTPPAKTRTASPPEKHVKRRKQSVKSDTEDEMDQEEARCEILADRALDLVPKGMLNWTEQFLSVYTDQSRSKLLKMKSKLCQESLSALRLWCEANEEKRHNGRHDGGLRG